MRLSSALIFFYSPTSALAGKASFFEPVEILSRNRGGIVPDSRGACPGFAGATSRSLSRAASGSNPRGFIRPAPPPRPFPRRYWRITPSRGGIAARGKKSRSPLRVSLAAAARATKGFVARRRRCNFGGVGFVRGIVYKRGTRERTTTPREWTKRAAKISVDPPSRRRDDRHKNRVATAPPSADLPARPFDTAPTSPQKPCGEVGAHRLRATRKSTRSRASLERRAPIPGNPDRRNLPSPSPAPAPTRRDCTTTDRAAIAASPPTPTRAKFG